MDSFSYRHRIQSFPTFIAVPATRMRTTATYCVWFWVLGPVPSTEHLQSVRRPTHCPDDRALRRHTHPIPPQYILGVLYHQNGKGPANSKAPKGSGINPTQAAVVILL
jgi:hypothetical protein